MVFHQLVAILHKDLLVEWKVRSRALSLATFAVTVLLLFSFAVGANIDALRQHAGAYLWMAMLFSSTFLLGQSFRLEVETGALETLQLLPVSPPALYYGKALANTVQLAILAFVSLPVTAVLYDAQVRESPGMLVGSIVLGVLGLAGPGTLHAALIARLQNRQLLLPLLLFPLIVPVLLAAVKSTTLVMTGDPMQQAGSWLLLLLCFDLVYWSLCGVLFARVLET